jgi:hypothetical protein
MKALLLGGLTVGVLDGLDAIVFFGLRGVVVTYYLVSRRFRPLIRRPLVFGPLYGLLVYGVMNFLVLPLSAAVTGPRTLPVVVNGLLIHVFGVGLPAAVFARAALRSNGGTGGSKQ